MLDVRCFPSVQGFQRANFHFGEFSPCEARAGRGAASIELAPLIGIPLSTLLRRGERESTSGMVAVARCAAGTRAGPFLDAAGRKRNIRAVFSLQIVFVATAISTCAP